MEENTKGGSRWNPGKDFIGVGCGALIVNEKDEVLLMKRGKKCKNEVGWWEQPGGSVKFNEKIEEAIKREIKEELDIDIALVRLLAVTNHILKEEGQHWVAPSYLAKITKGTPTIMEPEKCDEIRWFSLEKLPEKLSRTTVNSTEEYIKIKNSKAE